MIPRGTLGLCCVYIAQLMTHTAIYTLPFTLQLCYKPIGILQRVTKNQRVHISSHHKPYTKTKILFIRILKKSHRIGSVIRSRFRLNFVSTVLSLTSSRLSLILKESRKIGFVTRSRFLFNSVPTVLSLT